MTARERDHRRPESMTDAAIEAAGKVSEAFEWIERARGRLYDFHHLIGRADFLMEEGATLLERSGHRELAERIRRDVIGRNVLDGRWTFQIVEEFDELYYRPVERTEDRVRGRVTNGRRHVYEAELKEARRTDGLVGHESSPPTRHIDGSRCPDAR